MRKSISILDEMRLRLAAGGAEREASADGRARSCWADNGQGPAERVEPVCQAPKTAAAVLARAADAVVGDSDLSPLGGGSCRDVDGGCVRVLDDVRDGLGRDEVERRLVSCGQPV